MCCSAAVFPHALQNGTKNDEASFNEDKFLSLARLSMFLVEIMQRIQHFFRFRVFRVLGGGSVAPLPMKWCHKFLTLWLFLWTKLFTLSRRLQHNLHYSSMSSCHRKWHPVRLTKEFISEWSEEKISAFAWIWWMMYDGFGQTQTNTHKSSSSSGYNEN